MWTTAHQSQLLPPHRLHSPPKRKREASDSDSDAGSPAATPAASVPQHSQV
uniref:Uncharacterized protein n=1 Tax=Anguilla anguilla TaxID=7936 RepID=A0A0E9TNR4_ANGAN